MGHADSLYTNAVSVQEWNQQGFICMSSFTIKDKNLQNTGGQLDSLILQYFIIILVTIHMSKPEILHDPALHSTRYISSSVFVSV